MIDDYVKLCNMTSIDKTKNNKRKLIEENLSDGNARFDSNEIEKKK